MSEEAERWKEKYLQLAERQEQLDARWEQRVDLLRRSLVRSSDMAARLGGDEFAILLTGATVEQDAGQVAERLLHELSLPVPYRGTSLAVTVSVGAAFFPHHAEEFSRLYKAADEALYRAKQQGRASWVQQDGRAPADQPT